MSDLPARLVKALADRYTLQRELGRGGMATVYLAEDRKHHRLVAVKVLRPELATLLGPDRFLREIELAGRLTHPHILPLHDSGNADGILFYVMPYVEGESLADRLSREKQLPVRDAIQIAREVADALNYAHGHGVVHRDIKPGNILLSAGHAVVADFGIARAVDRARGDEITGTGVAVGTPGYMSPEQAAGTRDLDGRSDLYSLGCVLYEMLAGQPPFTGPTSESIVRQHLAAPPPKVTAIRPSVPSGLVEALDRSLAKTPADRFDTGAQFAEALGPRTSASVLGRPPDVVTLSHRPIPRRALIVTTVAVVIAGALLAWRAGREEALPAPTAHPRTAIAVLPFQNMSAEGPHSYFAGGLHDELMTQLSKVSALSVRGRASVMAYAGTDKSIKEIGEELGVGTLVEGTVQVVGDRLRVNIQLIDASTDGHLWAEGYDRTLDDAFAIQSEVARAVAAAVGAALGGDELRAISEAPTANAEAYRLFLQARQYWFRHQSRERENLEIAVRLYERAIELDPQFALAYAELSTLHVAMRVYVYDLSPSRLAAARKAAEAAIRLAPQLPQARIAMSALARQRGDFETALAELELARQGLPHDANVWWRIAGTSRRLGKWDQAERAFKRAVDLDPLSTNLIRNAGLSYEFTRHYADAVRAYDRSLLLAPDVLNAAFMKGWAYVRWQGQLDTIRAVLRRTPMDADLGPSRTPTLQHARLLLLERVPDSLIRLLTSAPPGVLETQDDYKPTSLIAAWAHRLRGDSMAARRAFDSALVTLNSALRVLPDDRRVHAARGFVLAGLGRSREALGEARWLEQSVVYRKDAFDGAWVAEDRARILVQAGAPESALDEIERLLAAPSMLTVHTLRLDPIWDPIREQPRFRTLLARFDP